MARPPSRPPPPAPVPGHGDRGGRVGDTLRHIYDDMLSEPVPKEFEELLKRLG